MYRLFRFKYFFAWKMCSKIPTRQQIGVSALAGKAPISNLSRRHGTSRKFVYAQKAKVSAALDDAFSDEEKDSEVLFYIPVTKAWLQQVALSLILIWNVQEF